MKILVDQNLQPEVAQHLLTKKYDAIHTSQIGMQIADDTEIFDYCRQENRILVTADVKLIKYLASSNAITPSVLIVRGYEFGTRTSPKLLPDIECALTIVNDILVGQDEAVFTLRINRPLRVRLLPLNQDEPAESRNH